MYVVTQGTGYVPTRAREHKRSNVRYIKFCTVLVGAPA